MRDDPPPQVTPGKSPHERFEELGGKLMRVPKAEVDKLDKKWQNRKQPKKRR